MTTFALMLATALLLALALLATWKLAAWCGRKLLHVLVQLLLPADDDETTRETGLYPDR